MLGIARLVFIAAVAVIDKRRRRKTTVAPGFLPDVAVIVPAYNEEKVIVKTIASLLASTYRGSMEILVVDDGSHDKTYECARAAFGDEPRVRIFSDSQRRKVGGAQFRPAADLRADRRRPGRRHDLSPRNHRPAGAAFCRSPRRRSGRQRQSRQPHQHSHAGGKHSNTSPARTSIAVPSTCSTASRWFPAPSVPGGGNWSRSWAALLRTRWPRMPT